MRILALVPGGIGDQILFFPTLADLKTQYPNAYLDVIVEPRAKTAYRVCPSVHEVLTFDFKDRNSLAEYLNLLGTIRDREYDLAVTLGQRWTVGALLWLNGIPARIGYETKPGWFLSSMVPLKTEQYAAHMYHDLLQGLGHLKPCPPLAVALPSNDIEWAEAEQRRLDIKESGYVLIHGGASKLSQQKGIEKIYPVASWQKIIASFQEKQPDLPLVLLKGPEDQEWIAQMQAKAPNLKVVSPPDIGKLAAFQAAANLMLCTDSAPMHLAIAVGTPTFALFGPTCANKLMPDDARFVGIQSPTDAIADIKPESILEKIWGA
ncbi:MAG: glycosyltransferase family 9 protein [Cyanobacteria bacterium P01_H01_bin.15]